MIDNELNVTNVLTGEVSPIVDWTLVGGTLVATIVTMGGTIGVKLNAHESGFYSNESFTSNFAELSDEDIVPVSDEVKQALDEAPMLKPITVDEDTAQVVDGVIEPTEPIATPTETAPTAFVNDTADEV